MGDMNKKDCCANKPCIHSIGKLLSGAILGTIVVIAGVLALSKKSTNEKVEDVISEVKDKAIGYGNEVQRQVRAIKRDVQEKLDKDLNT